MGLLDNISDVDYYSSALGAHNYQITSLDDIINQFMFVYVGADKIIPKTKKNEVAFHAQRALQELSFDTLRSLKSEEVVVSASLQMRLPKDYVNYTKLSWVDSAGIKHLLYPASKTSNPIKNQTDDDGEYLFNDDGNLIQAGELITNGNFHGSAEGWLLNTSPNSLGGIEIPNSVNQPVTFITSPASQAGDPLKGWHYEKNGVRAYDLGAEQAFTQTDVDIRSDESYQVSIVISGYVTGNLKVILVDENGDYAETSSITSNGTHTEVIIPGKNGLSATFSSAGNFAYRGCVIISQKHPTTLSDNGVYKVESISVVRVGDEESSATWGNYKSSTPSENNNDDYDDDNYWPHNGQRYGLDPQHAQVNGSFYIDNVLNTAHFSSNISGKTVILDYISDGLGTDGEMVVHKFAEEAMYKSIIYAIISTRTDVSESVIRRYKKERFAAIRTAKLRLSNIKLEELTQILRGKSKQIKH